MDECKQSLFLNTNFECYRLDLNYYKREDFVERFRAFDPLHPLRPITFFIDL